MLVFWEKNLLLLILCKSTSCSWTFSMTCFAYMCLQRITRSTLYFCACKLDDMIPSGVCQYLAMSWTSSRTDYLRRKQKMIICVSEAAILVHSLFIDIKLLYILDKIPPLSKRAVDEGVWCWKWFSTSSSKNEVYLIYFFGYFSIKLKVLMTIISMPSTWNFKKQKL